MHKWVWSYCFAPPPDLPAGHLSYYLVCNEACYPNPFTQFQMSADQALVNISRQQESISTFAEANNLMDVRVGVVRVGVLNIH